MFIAINRCSSRVPGWCFGIIRAQKGKQFFPLVVVDGINGAVAGTSALFLKLWDVFFFVRYREQASYEKLLASVVAWMCKRFLTVQVGNILQGPYQQIVYSLWAVMIIGVGPATLSFDDRKLVGRLSSSAGGRTSIKLPIHHGIVRRPSSKSGLLALLGTKSAFTSSKFASVYLLFKYRLVRSCIWPQYLWWIATSEFFFIVGISFLAAARDNLLFSETADSRFVSNRYDVLTPMNDCLVGLPKEFCVYEIVSSTTSDSTLAYLVLQNVLKVDWERTCTAMEAQFAHYNFTTGRHSVSLNNVCTNENGMSGVKVNAMVVVWGL